jgi:hypothetical protein
MDSIRRGIAKIIDDTPLRVKLREAGHAQAAKFSAATYLTRLAAGYARLM